MIGRFILRGLLGAGLSATAVWAATDSNLPDEGPVDVSAVPTDVMAVAAAQCPGFLANQARFDWSRDTGMFVIEGRCQGEDVRIQVTGDGRLDYFTTIETE